MTRFANSAALAAMILLTSCGRPAEQPAANQAAKAPPKPAAAPVPSLAGTWTVTNINGYPPTQVWPLAATAAGDQFTVRSDCRTFVWKYRQDRNIVQLTPQPTRECSRGRSPDEERIEEPVTLANIAMFSKDGREVQLTGSGGRITLARR